MTTPSNRRVGRPKLPPDVVAGLVEEGAGTADGREPAAQETAARAPREIDLASPWARRWLRALAVVRTAAGVALVVAVACAVAWGARRYVTTSPRFAVTEVVVRGVHRGDDEAIAARAGIALGANVFAVDLDVARAQLLADPWAKEVTLARRLPGTIVVELSERDAAALLALGGDVYVVSRDAEVVKRLEPGDPSDLPVVTGISPEAMQDDREGATRTVRRALDLAGDYERTALATRSPLQEIHVAADGGLTLVVGKSGLALVLGEPPYRRKLDQAARVLTEVDRQGAKADAVMLDNEARPERVVVRMR